MDDEDDLRICEQCTQEVPAAEVDGDGFCEECSALLRLETDRLDD